MSAAAAHDEVTARTARPSAGRRAAMCALRFVALAYLGWCAALFLLQGKLLFPTSLANATATGVAPGVEQLWITTPEGHRVEAWFVPPELGSDIAAADGRWPAVIFFHGNAETIDHSIGHAEMYAAMGWAVLLPEYRGYGRSGGSPSQKSIGADMREFYDMLAARPEIDASRIVFHGRSIGTGVACDLAAARPASGLILESAFTSVASFCWRYGVPAWICRHPFRNDRVVAAFGGPILVMHGSDDEIIPVGHGRRLRDLAKDATYLELPAGHNDFPPDWGAYESAVRTFLAKIGAEPAT